MDDKNYLTTAAGVKMPRLIYGTAWKKDRTAELVVKAVQAGFKGIDTACQPKHYAEAEVGRALQLLKKQGIGRESLYIQTKFTPLSGQDPNQVPYDKSAPVETQVAQSFEVSKKNLQTGYVDSLILHSPLFPFSQLKKAWRAMETLSKNGGARQLGISNCYDLQVLQRIHAEAEIKPAFVQNRFYDETGYDTQLRQWCSDHGTLYQSFWSLTANPDILASDTLADLAKKYGKTQAQLFFRYLTQVGIVPLTGTTSAQHMKEDLDIFDMELSADEMKSISRLLVSN